MNKEIVVKTAFGDLVAAVGCDLEYPEILVFLRNSHGHELMVAAITDMQTPNVYDALRVAIYENTTTDDYSRAFRVGGDDIRNEDAMWQ